MKVVVFKDDWNVHSVVEDSLRYGMFFAKWIETTDYNGIWARNLRTRCSLQTMQECVFRMMQTVAERWKNWETLGETLLGMLWMVLQEPMSRLIEEVFLGPTRPWGYLFLFTCHVGWRRFWSQKRRTQGEIQSEKQQSILPCVISDNAAAFLSVLHFLKPHRVTVERKRQDAHSIYMRPGKETVWLRQSDGRSNRARDDVFSYFWGELFRDINEITDYFGNSTRQWILDTTHHWDRQNPNPKERWVQSSNLGKMSQVSVQSPIIGGFKCVFVFTLTWLQMSGLKNKHLTWHLHSTNRNVLVSSGLNAMKRHEICEYERPKTQHKQGKKCRYVYRIVFETLLDHRIPAKKELPTFVDFVGCWWPLILSSFFWLPGKWRRFSISHIF